MKRRIIYTITALASGASIAAAGTALAAGGHVKVHHPRIAHAALSTTAPDPAGPNDQSNGPDPAGTTADQPSSEQVGSDGPGGHADESTNATADHEVQGAE